MFDNARKKHIYSSESNQPISQAKPLATKQEKLSSNHLINFSDTLSPQSDKMRLARETLQTDRQKSQGLMGFNLFSFAKLCSPRGILLTCGAYFTLCNPRVMSQCLALTLTAGDQEEKNVHMESKCFLVFQP